MWQIGGGDANPLVHHRDHRLLSNTLKADNNRAGWRRVFERVGEQIADHALDVGQIRNDKQRRTGVDLHA